VPYGAPAAFAEQVAVVRAIYDGFVRRDLDAILPLIADGCEFLPIGTAQALGRTEPYVGHAGVREYFADAARVWEEFSLHAHDIRAAGSGVVVFGHVRGRTGGQSVRRRVVWVWQVAGGKAVSMRVSDIGELDEAE
jgi:ketosteroid isomerase-like protein